MPASVSSRIFTSWRAAAGSPRPPATRRGRTRRTRSDWRAQVYHRRTARESANPQQGRQANQGPRGRREGRRPESIGAADESVGRRAPRCDARRPNGCWTAAGERGLAVLAGLPPALRGRQRPHRMDRPRVQPDGVDRRIGHELRRGRRRRRPAALDQQPLGVQRQNMLSFLSAATARPGRPGERWPLAGLAVRRDDAIDAAVSLVAKGVS